MYLPKEKNVRTLPHSLMVIHRLLREWRLWLGYIVAEKNKLKERNKKRGRKNFQNETCLH